MRPDHDQYEGLLSGGGLDAITVTQSDADRIALLEKLGACIPASREASQLLEAYQLERQLNGADASI